MAGFVPPRDDAVLREMGFAHRGSAAARYLARYVREGRHGAQVVIVGWGPLTTEVWFAPRTTPWDPGIKFDTPEAAVSFAEVEQWGRADVQGAV